MRNKSSRLSFEQWAAKVAACRAEVVRLKQVGYPHEIDRAVEELVAAEAEPHADPVEAASPMTDATGAAPTE
jgi:hypothetical protein